jgi:UDP-N-acetylmuramyl pentapeptide synthase
MRRRSEILYLEALRLAAWCWRRMLPGTVFVGITGSVGKTTTKELLGAILSRHGRTLISFDTSNGPRGLPRSILSVRPWNRYAVLEVAGGVPGLVARGAALVRPHLAVAVAIADLHQVTLEAALRVLRTDRGVRRWLVLGNVTDTRMGSHAKGRWMGTAAAEAADEVVLLIGVRFFQVGAG